MEPLSVGPRKIDGKRIIFLQERDILILRHLLIHRFATAEQIRNLFWSKELAYPNHYRRLGELMRERFIQKLVGDHGVHLGYTLTPQGISYLKQSGASVDTTQTKRVFYRSTFAHDKALNDVRVILEKSPIVSDYFSELQVRVTLAKRHGIQASRDEKYKVPDALFTLKTRKGPLVVALELEMTLKSKARYQKIFEQLSINSDFQLIFIIAKTESMKIRLIELLNEVRRNNVWVKAHRIKPGFYFSTLTEVMAMGLDARMHGEGEEFSLNDLAKPKDQIAP